ncbi:MAG: hypothetical protein FJX29_11275 [Alphaproteobacteria bacterium]|nr:hypothetical protein [Alphaproteobacteria bacterium]
MTSALVIEPNAEDEMIACSCCAGAPGLRGTVLRDGAPLAIYFGDPAGMPNYPLLRLGLVTGPWRDDTQASERCAIAFTCAPPRANGAQPQILPTEPYLPGFQEFPFLGQALCAAQIAAHPALASWLELAQAVIAHDPRLQTIREPAGSPSRNAIQHLRRVASASAPGQSSP